MVEYQIRPTRIQILYVDNRSVSNQTLTDRWDKDSCNNYNIFAGLNYELSSKSNQESMWGNGCFCLCVDAGGVQRLRRRKRYISLLPHNGVHFSERNYGLNFRTKVLKWNVFDVLVRCSHGESSLICDKSQ
ncbi:MAG: hypothetical protein RR938_02470 [Muribaculaceae bacterium]